MSALATRRETERFRASIGRQIGLRFDDNKLAFLAEVLQRRLKDRCRDSASYLVELDGEPPHGELTALARELTVGETYFFRNNEQFRALAEVVLPERLRIERSPRVLRMLSAGCSSGEEPYSMAIVASETVLDPAWSVSVRAIDLNPLALEKAARGRYSGWALRETGAESRGRWFCADGRDFRLDDRIRTMVTFEQANLAAEHPDLWRPESYDVIFCRNVLMYFEPEQMRTVVSRLARALSPGGYLFLGHAETLRGVSDRFRLCNSHETFYHQLKDGAGDDERIVSFTPRRPATREPDGGAAWFDEIRLANERVAALLPLSSADSTTEGIPSDPFDPAPALELVRQERFAEALDHVRSQAGAAGRDRDALLLEAVLLLHTGQIDAAEAAASRLIRSDANDGAATYIRALCREHTADHAGAIEQHWVAASLLPSFAMPRLHLGLLLRRAGRKSAARREFEQALALFAREEATRLLLFGGGFSREALMALCRSALMECGKSS